MLPEAAVSSLYDPKPAPDMAAKNYFLVNNEEEDNQDFLFA